MTAAYSGQSSPPALIQVCGGSGNGLDPCPAIQLASQEFNRYRGHSSIKVVPSCQGYGIYRNRTDGFRSSFVSISSSTWAEVNTEPEYLGCSAHYSRAGHARLATELLPQIRQILDW